MVIVVPIYEEERPASTTTPPPSSTPTARTSASTARTTSRTRAGLLGEVLLPPGQPRLPGVRDAYAKVGVYICYDRHFPEGARALGLNGAEIVFNPSATVAGLSEYLWKLEQPAHAVANGYFVGAINRVGTRRRGTSASSTARATSATRAARSPNVACTSASCTIPVTASALSFPYFALRSARARVACATASDCRRAFGLFLAAGR
jgi:hypothetical protein